MRLQNSQNLLLPGKLEENVRRKINLINVATYNIGHEVTKKKGKTFSYREN